MILIKTPVTFAGVFRIIIRNQLTQCTMRTIDKIISKVDTKRGAPMGRFNVGVRPVTVTRGRNGRICKCDQTKIFDCAVPMYSDGAYDKGGAYWGIGKQLRVAYTKDLKYIEFYRVGENNW